MRTMKVVAGAVLVVLITACGSSTPPLTLPKTNSNHTPTSSAAGPHPAKVPATGTIGFLGCSNTDDAVLGYEKDVNGPGRFWDIHSGYGGGAISDWANSDMYWALFEAQLAKHPVVAIWWHLCMHPHTTQAEVDAVFARLRQDVGPSVPIYVSAMASYSAAGECPMADPAGSEVFYHQLISSGKVLPGPVLTPLSPQNTKPDGCHPQKSALLSDGQRLKAF